LLPLNCSSHAYTWIDKIRSKTSNLDDIEY
jgi:hypothetical protein